jgi:hypothetical protein
MVQFEKLLTRYDRTYCLPMYDSETEGDTRAERIDPVLKAAGWGSVDGTTVWREVICPGRIMPGSKRGNPFLIQCGEAIVSSEPLPLSRSPTAGSLESCRHRGSLHQGLRRQEYPRVFQPTKPRLPRSKLVQT